MSGMKKRSAKQFAHTLFGVLAVLFCASPALAQSNNDAGQSRKPRSGWAVQCNDAGQGLTCKAVQSITVRRTRQRLLTVSVQRNADGKTAAVLYLLPHGLFLPAGMEAAIDTSKPEKLVIQTCDRRGCYAGTQLSSADLGKMSKGKVLAISFQNLTKKAITLKMPLLGFSEAWAKLN